MIKVYFESKVASELVATFESEDTYMACLPALEKQCKDEGYDRVTESLMHNVKNTCLDWSGLDMVSYFNFNGDVDLLDAYNKNPKIKEFFDSEIEGFFEENNFSIITRINKEISDYTHYNSVSLKSEIEEILKNEVN